MAHSTRSSPLFELSNCEFELLFGHGDRPCAGLAQGGNAEQSGLQKKNRQAVKTMARLLKQRGPRFIVSHVHGLTNRSMASSSAPITRIIRFEDTSGSVHFGEEPVAGASNATILNGDIYAGLVRSDTTAEISRLLSPVAPTNILCVGLNYMRHWEEGAKKRGVACPENPVSTHTDPMELHAPHHLT